MIQRYDSPTGIMDAAADGEHILYTDHAAAIAELTEALEDAAYLLDTLRRIANAEEGDILKKARATLDKYKGES